MPRSSLLSALRPLDALLAWVLLGWMGQRLGWSFASGVLPVVVWWAVRCGALASPRVWPLAVSLLAGLSGPLAGQHGLLALLLGSALWGRWSASLAPASGDAGTGLGTQAMGLMMGSLWLSSQWCLGPGWSDAQAVALHLGLMLGVPLLLSPLRRLGQPGWPPAALLAAGALLMAWPQAGGWRLAGMLLLVLAGCWPTQGKPPVARFFGRVPSALGPLLLLGAGLLAPTQGPAAMQTVWALVAALALLGLPGLLSGRPLPAGAARHTPAH